MFALQARIANCDVSKKNLGSRWLAAAMPGLHTRIQQTMEAEQSVIGHRVWGGGKTAPFSDPAFDGQTVGDVWRLMCRAEKWLESRGCVITLDGEFHETKVRKLKKE